MRVINHLFRKKVKRDDDTPVYDPGKAMEEDRKQSEERYEEDFEDFVQDHVKEDVYHDISEFINGS